MASSSPLPLAGTDDDGVVFSVALNDTLLSALHRALQEFW